MNHDLIKLYLLTINITGLSRKVCLMNINHKHRKRSFPRRFRRQLKAPRRIVNLSALRPIADIRA